MRSDASTTRGKTAAALARRRFIRSSLVLVACFSLFLRAAGGISPFTTQRVSQACCGGRKQSSKRLRALKEFQLGMYMHRANTRTEASGRHEEQPHLLSQSMHDAFSRLVAVRLMWEDAQFDHTALSRDSLVHPLRLHRVRPRVVVVVSMN